MSETPASNAFLDLVRDVREGVAQAELHRHILDLVGSVRSVGKAGELTLKLKIAPAAGNSEALLVTETITVKAPEPARESTLLFADDNNRLSRNHPNQPKLPSMDRQPAEVRQMRAVGSSSSE